MSISYYLAFFYKNKRKESYTPGTRLICSSTFVQRSAPNMVTTLGRYTAQSFFCMSNATLCADSCNIPLNNSRDPSPRDKRVRRCKKKAGKIGVQL